MKRRDKYPTETKNLIPVTEEMRGGVSLAEAAGLLMGIMRDCRDLFKEVKGELDTAQKGGQMRPLDISRLLRGTGRGSFPRMERFHKEVRLDDVKGVTELVSMMKRAGGKGK